MQTAPHPTINALAPQARADSVRRLHHCIVKHADADAALWQAVIAHQGCQLRTSSGLLFSYTVKRNKHGEYSGEVLVSRKEDSKTLTKSSILLAFHKVLAEAEIVNAQDSSDDAGAPNKIFLPPEYKGPKAIGQIFGISYVYSLFWKLGLIKVPPEVAEKFL